MAIITFQVKEIKPINGLLRIYIDPKKLQIPFEYEKKDVIKNEILNQLKNNIVIEILNEESDEKFMLNLLLSNFGGDIKKVHNFINIIYNELPGNNSVFNISHDQFYNWYENKEKELNE